MEGLQTLEGVLEHLIFRDRPDGWSPGRVRLRVPLVLAGDEFVLGEGEIRTISAVGRWPGVSPGMPVRLRGVWKEHTQYGRQFAFDEVEVLEVSAAADIAAFLAHRLPKVGKIRAGRIVEKYGEGTARVLDENPEALAEIPSISMKMVEEIKRAWLEYREEYGLVKQLQRYALPPQWRTAAIHKWKLKAPEVLERDVFVLVDEVGAPFDVADVARVAVGLPDDDPRRVRAGLKHLLASEVESQGHTRIEYVSFLNLVAVFLHVPPDAVISVLPGVAVVLEEPGCRWVQRAETWEAEGEIARFVLGVPREEPVVAPVTWDEDGCVEVESTEPSPFVPLELPEFDALVASFPEEKEPSSALLVGAGTPCDRCRRTSEQQGWSFLMPCCRRVACRDCFERAGSVRSEQSTGLTAPCPFCPARIVVSIEQGCPVRVA